MAALEHSSSQNLNLADWPVWRNATGRNGSGAAILSVITGVCSAIDVVHCNTMARHQRREPDAAFITAMRTAPACAYGR